MNDSVFGKQWKMWKNKDTSSSIKARRNCLVSEKNAIQNLFSWKSINNENLKNLNMYE